MNKYISRVRAENVRRAKLPKLKIWSTDKADTKFSLFIRQRDQICRFQGCSVGNVKKLQCSHYIGRAHSATRYDPNNCISLCWRHHFKDKLLGFEYQKQIKEKHGYDGQYTLFMKKLLGKKFKDLIFNGRTTLTRSDAIE